MKFLVTKTARHAADTSAGLAEEVLLLAPVAGAGPPEVQAVQQRLGRVVAIRRALGRRVRREGAFLVDLPQRKTQTTESPA